MAASIYKWLVIPVLGLVLTSATPPVVHPLHVSVVEINHNKEDKTIEVSCKIFTDDFEKILTKNYKAKVDLTNPVSKPAMDSLVKKYIFSHLSISVNGKPVALSYVGFETQTDASYAYVEVDNVPAMNKMEVATNLMYDMYEDQMNIIHATINGANRQSNKITFPETNIVFNF